MAKKHLKYTVPFIVLLLNVANTVNEKSRCHHGTVSMHCYTSRILISQSREKNTHNSHCSHWHYYFYYNLVRQLIYIYLFLIIYLFAVRSQFLRQLRKRGHFLKHRRTYFQRKGQLRDREYCCSRTCTSTA